MVIDVLILILMALAIFIGKIRGLNACIIGILSWFLSIVLATMLCRPLGYFLIDNTSIDENIKQSIMNSQKMEEFDSKKLEQYPAQIRNLIGYAEQGINTAQNNIKETIAEQLAKQAMFAIAYIIIVIVTKIFILVLKIISKVIEKLPVFKQINDIGGGVCGFIEGAIIIYCLIAIISVFSPMMKDSWIITEINQSYVAKQIYYNNILANIIIKFN